MPSTHWRANDNNMYDQPPTKVGITNKYAALELNGNFTLRYVKPSRSAVTLQEWDHRDYEACDQIEINCVGF